jgi:hypothetical protein
VTHTQQSDPYSAHYAELIVAARRRDSLIDHDTLTALLMQSVGEDHLRSPGGGPLVEFTQGTASYLFAWAGAFHADRTLLAVSRPEPAEDAPDSEYQQGHPRKETIAGRPVDLGYFIPYSAGGLYGPNLFVLDRVLNRGWSRDGRAYHAMQRAAVTGAPGTVMFVRAHYSDDSDVPVLIDLGVASGAHADVRRFRNRFDDATWGGPQDRLAITLPAATDAQIGALGEETAAVLLETVLDATIVAMGDAALPRDGGRQDLDLLAIVDDRLIAYEVKTRYISTTAGGLTRAGNLPRPRLRAGRRPDAHRQGRQAYVADRLRDHVDTTDQGIGVRVIAIDFMAMLAQQFAVNDDGTGLSPLDSPIDCTAAARQALTQIMTHRDTHSEVR